ncbi:hypothetical protein [Microbulbifer thermotolerans]|uniref:Uncharacterized protein n=1 Tax=Microbulbifer thermotolerans TaxID=252514 RepID=A0A143HK15_MICTH|nr:hypothetical protein [Microbulbifer thermotolerans]AMX01612.1 hypothetical protein A3224_02585 [Microbulbifer thermotolerans]
MHKKVRLYVGFVFILLLIAVAWRYFSFSQIFSSVVVAESNGAAPRDNIRSEFAAPERDALLRLLSDPRIQTYFQRQEDKLRLSAYFLSEEGSPTDEEAWRLIESIEQDGRILAYEAMALKIAWLERNSKNKTEFDAAAEAMVKEYRQKAMQSAEEYDPYKDVPGFAEYKEAERRIVQEVQQMTSFPNGMSRHEYLRHRLQEAREEAYGR